MEDWPGEEEAAGRGEGSTGPAKWMGYGKVRNRARRRDTGTGKREEPKEIGNVQLSVPKRSNVKISFRVMQPGVAVAVQWAPVRRCRSAYRSQENSHKLFHS